MVPRETGTLIWWEVWCSRAACGPPTAGWADTMRTWGRAPAPRWLTSRAACWWEAEWEEEEGGCWAAAEAAWLLGSREPSWGMEGGATSSTLEGGGGGRGGGGGGGGGERGGGGGGGEEECCHPPLGRSGSKAVA